MNKMNLKKYAATLLLFVAVITVSAQDKATIYQHAKYCMTFADCKDGRWTEADSVVKVSRTEGQVKWSGGTSVRFNATDKELAKTLKSKAFAVVMNDTLYVNLHGMKHSGAKWGNGYSVAFPYDNFKQLLFVERYISRGQNMKVAVGAGLGGMVGGAIMAGVSCDWHNKVCYLIGPDTKKATCIDGDMMAEILKDRPELLEKFNQPKTKKERRMASNVMPILMETGLVAAKPSTITEQ